MPSLETLESLNRDSYGTLHDAREPLEARHQAEYGDLDRPAFECGCQPLLHCFRCAACQRLFGWCYGASGACHSENECCNTCVVAMWQSAKRCKIPLPTLQKQLDKDPIFRRRVYDMLLKTFGETP